MINVFRGYIRTRNKKPTQKFGNGETLLSLEEACLLQEYAGILNGQFTAKDIDDAADAEKVYTIICNRNINCRVMKTTRGMQFFFGNSKWVNKNLIHAIDPLAIVYELICKINY
jgi:putative DNA primase/helicase